MPSLHSGSFHIKARTGPDATDPACDQTRRLALQFTPPVRCGPQFFIAPRCACFKALGCRQPAAVELLEEDFKLLPAKRRQGFRCRALI